VKGGEAIVPTNLAIDDKLLEEALRAGGHRTKRATVNEALEEYIRRRKRLCAVASFGTIVFDHRYDYKRARRRG
jgi:Arc/MetJ family transcription regulator